MGGITLNHTSPRQFAGIDMFAGARQSFGTDMASVKNGPDAMPASPRLSDSSPTRAASRGGLNSIGDRSPGTTDGKKLAADLQGVGGRQAQERAAESPRQARIQHAASTDRYLKSQTAAAAAWMDAELGGNFIKLMDTAKSMEKYQLEDLALNCYLLSHSGTKPMSPDVKDVCRAFVRKALDVVKDPSRKVDGFHQGTAKESFRAVHSAVLNELGASAIYREAISDFKERAERDAVDHYLNQGELKYRGPASDVIDWHFKYDVENALKMFEASFSGPLGSTQPDEVAMYLASAVRTIARVETFVKDVRVPGDADTEKEPASLPNSDEAGSPSTDAMPGTAEWPKGLSARKPGPGPWGGGDMDAMRFSQWDNCFSPQFHVKTDTAEAFQVAMEPIKELLNMLQWLLSERLKPHEALPSAASTDRQSADKAPDVSTEQTVASVPVSEMEPVDSKLESVKFVPPPPPRMPNAREEPRDSRQLAAPPDWQAKRAAHVRGMGDDLKTQLEQGRTNLRKVRIQESNSVPDMDDRPSVTQVGVATTVSGATSKVSQTGNEQHTGGHEVKTPPVAVLSFGGQRAGTNAGATSVRSSS